MFVSIIVPCRDERDYIGDFVGGLAAQRADGFQFEVLIADGMSVDGTREILQELASKSAFLRVVDNPEQVVSTGLNVAIRKAKGEIVVRMDVHTQYAEDYVKQCVETLRKTEAQCVGGPWRAIGTDPIQIAIADAFQSPLGSGGALSRKLTYEGQCDTVYLGCWWRKYLLEIGGFDEHLVRNQDDELCLRISKAGGRIWQSASIKSAYAPRSSFSRLFKQFQQYGYWKVAVSQKHGQHASIRHLAPVTFVGGIALLTMLSLLSDIAKVVLALSVICYFGLIGASAIRATENSKLKSVVFVAIAIMIMHVGYGVGYGLGIVDFRILRKSTRVNMSNLSR